MPATCQASIEGRLTEKGVDKEGGGGYGVWCVVGEVVVTVLCVTGVSHTGHLPGVRAHFRFKHAYGGVV